MATGPKLFTCPKCRHRYLGHEPLPDCPRCGYDYRETEGFRWDVLAYLLVIIGLLSFLLVTSYYRGNIGVAQQVTAMSQPDGEEKLPGSGTAPALPLQSPSREPGR
ncbi:MAG: hypothetical protein HY205_01985 [Nitrospirae bacterium]|nr:hypothetical protein [Nitrospirota bacterium]